VTNVECQFYHDHPATPPRPPSSRNILFHSTYSTRCLVSIYLSVLITPGILPCETSAPAHAARTVGKRGAHSRFPVAPESVLRFALYPVDILQVHSLTHISAITSTVLCDGNVLSDPIRSPSKDDKTHVGSRLVNAERNSRPKSCAPNRPSHL
jgi:hypothetical protein